MTLQAVLFLLAATSSTLAFQPISRSTKISTTQLRSTAFQVDVNIQAPRNYNSVIEWASYYGVAQENFQIAEQFGEWGGVAAQPGTAGQRVLYVPGVLRLTSSAVRQTEFAALEPVVAQYFDATNSNGNINLACHFYLFLKILQEYDMGEQSPYFAWLDSLPRQFSTAITFDPFELDCLPPFVKFLAKQDINNFDLFMEVLQQVNIPSISDSTKYNINVCKWAFNVVFTRARAAFGEAEIIPISDMLNHNANPNVEVQYDPQGNVHVTLLQNVQAGEPLFKCYGGKTNPSKFLATFGFFDTSSPATYCKLMTGKVLTPELVNLGFVYDRMVFYVENGAIAEEVWDVMLYTILESIDPNAKQQFYQAHMNGDVNTKAQFHQAYRLQTCDGLLQHVHEMLDELAACATRIQQGRGQPQQHPNLAMIQQHNDFVRETFLKVRSNLESIKAGGM